ncbi:MAG: Uma2 family endonuclease [Gammaproteobacteria bacterium]
MSAAMEDWPRRHRITVDEYYRMAEVGLLAPDARVELIDGEIIDMAPIGNPHMATVDRINRLLFHAVGERAIVRCQGAVQLGDYSAPQPDFVLLAPREDYYASRRAISADTLLTIEVSDTTLRYDSGRKMSLYARHNVPELWVIDVPNARVHLFRKPSGNEYLEASILEAPDALSIERLPGIVVDLSSIYIR